MNEKEPLNMWGKLEAMGHQAHLGHITEERFGPVSLFRVDMPGLPATEKHEIVPPYSKLYGAASIYCLTPMEEAAVLALLEEDASSAYRYRRPYTYAIAAADRDPFDDGECEADRDYSNKISEEALAEHEAQEARREEEQDADAEAQYERTQMGSGY